MNPRTAVLAVVVIASGTMLAGAEGAEQLAPRCSEEMSALLLKHARKHGVPIDLLHRIVIRESRYNAAAHHKRYFGLMQITYATAKSMGYRGAPNGLLDAETNLTYAVPYLANAYMLSHGNDDRAVRLYAAGYYATAKQQHMIADLRSADSPAVVPVKIAMVETEAPSNPVSRLFGMLTSPPAPQAAAGPSPADTAPAATPTGEGKAPASAPSGKPAVHAGDAKMAPSNAAGEKSQVAASSAKSDDRLRGADEPLPATLSTSATADAPASPAAAGKQDKPRAKVQVAAAAKAKNKATRLAKKPRPATEPAVETADAGGGEGAATPDAAEERTPALKAAPAKQTASASKKQIAAAAPAGDDDAAETTQVAGHAPSKAKHAARHARVLQAAASKADVTADQ